MPKAILSAPGRWLATTAASRRRASGGGVERLPAGFGRVGAVEHGEDAEHGVAEDIQHLPAAVFHGAGRAFEIDVEHGQELLERQAVGEPCRIAHAQYQMAVASRSPLPRRMVPPKMRSPTSEPW